VFTIRKEIPTDIDAREALLDTCFGQTRHTKTSERLREGRLPARNLALSATAADRLIGTVRLWHISAGYKGGKLSCPALLLGPLAVSPEYQSLGVGSALMHASIEAATLLGHRAILLVGDAPYYARFGFSAEKTNALYLPGPFARERFLALELVPKALEDVQGLIAATGQLTSMPNALSQLPQAA
jgi:predicted N-acetyltransferase YhbS